MKEEVLMNFRKLVCAIVVALIVPGGLLMVGGAIIARLVAKRRALTVGSCASA